MKDHSDENTLLFIFVFALCLLGTIASYIGLTPEVRESSSGVLFFLPPENAS